MTAETVQGRPAVDRRRTGSPVEVEPLVPPLVNTAAGGTAPLGRLLAALDAVCAVVALAVARPSLWLALPVVLLTALALVDSDLYRRRLRLSALDDVPQLWGRGTVVPSIVASAALLVGRPGPAHDALATGALFALLTTLGHTVVYTSLRRRRRRGLDTETAIFMGAGPTAQRAARTLLEQPVLGMRPVAFVDRRGPAAIEQLPVLRHSRLLSEYVAHFSVHAVFVTPAELSVAEVVDQLRGLDRLDCDVFVVPELHELQTWMSQTEEIGGIPVRRLRRAAHRSVSWRVKRAFDVLVAGAVLLAASPLIGVAALAARIDGGPGVIFRQQRVGIDGRLFTIYKLRSLRPATEHESQTHWNVERDPRLSTFGRWLRRSCIDELPQLWNVLRGDMSLVGPRPERPHFVEQFEVEHAHYAARQRVPVGLTGWAQVHGLRGDTSISDRAHYDNQYIENWSLWLDVKVLLLTVSHVLRELAH